MCVLDLGDQPIDGEHEILSALVWAIGQQRPSVCCEHVIATSARPALYFPGAQMCEPTNVIGTLRMPKRGKQGLERESGGKAVLHVAVQHSTLFSPGGPERLMALDE